MLGHRVTRNQNPCFTATCCSLPTVVEFMLSSDSFIGSFTFVWREISTRVATGACPKHAPAAVSRKAHCLFKECPEKAPRIVPGNLRQTGEGARSSTANPTPEVSANVLQ